MEGENVKRNSSIEMVRIIATFGNAIKLGVRGFVRICIETCAKGCFYACMGNIRGQTP